MKFYILKGISWENIIAPKGEYKFPVKDDKQKTMIAGKIARKVVSKEMFEYDVDNNILKIKIVEETTFKKIHDAMNLLLS